MDKRSADVENNLLPCACSNIILVEGKVVKLQ